MKINRRDILTNGLIIGAGLATAGCMPAVSDTTKNTAKRSLGKLGVQLYTLRDVFEPEPVKTLQQVREIGFDFVEFGGANYDKMDHTVLRKTMDEIGLTTPSCHLGLDKYQTDPDAAIKMLKTLGAKYMTIPWIGEDYRNAEGWKKLGQTISEIGKKLAQEDLRIAYHNHEFEFDIMENGEIAYDILVSHCDPQYVDLEMDLFWATQAKVNIEALYNKYSGRFHMCHVKDMNAAGEMVNVGDGIIDFARYAALEDIAGMEYYIVEHDNPTAPSINAVGESYTAAKAIQY